jgi:hypothetical protein
MLTLRLDNIAPSQISFLRALATSLLGGVLRRGRAPPPRVISRSRSRSAVSCLTCLPLNIGRISGGAFESHALLAVYILVG